MNLDLETLKWVKSIFDIQSDMSSRCNGYRSLLQMISEREVQENRDKKLETLLDDPNVCKECGRRNKK